MRYCGKCGAPVPRENDYCNLCGTFYTGTQADGTPIVKAKKSPTEYMGLVMMGVFFVAFISIAVVIFINAMRFF